MILRSTEMNRTKLMVFHLGTLVVFLLDFLSKSWAVSTLSKGSIEVCRPWLYWVLAKNTGAAWSAFSGYPWLLAAIGCVVLIGIEFCLWRRSLSWWGILSLCLLSGGIIGNTWDRVVHGYVIDFIFVDLQFYAWPIFNIADIGMCLGAVMGCMPHKFFKESDKSV